MSSEYTCAVCHQTWEKGWSDDEAMLEFKNDFGDIPLNVCVIICDDCYVKMGFRKGE